MKKEHVNLHNTRVWVKCNEDSRAHLWRAKFVNMHGGEFTKNETHWEWREIEEKTETSE